MAKSIFGDIPKQCNVLSSSLGHYSCSLWLLTMFRQIQNVRIGCNPTHTYMRVSLNAMGFAAKKTHIGLHCKPTIQGDVG